MKISMKIIKLHIGKNFTEIENNQRWRVLYSWRLKVEDYKVQ